MRNLSYMCAPAVQKPFDGARELLGLPGWGITGDRTAFPVNQKLCEVPADGARAERTQNPGPFAPQELKKKMSGRPIDLDFGEDWEGDSEAFFAEFGNLSS